MNAIDPCDFYDVASLLSDDERMVRDSVAASWMNVYCRSSATRSLSIGFPGNWFANWPGMATGEIVGCFGLTEPHGGSDPATMKTHARGRGADWVLNGSKMWITNGSIADVCIVWAFTS